MGSRPQRRHLEDIQRRLSTARESLRILEEQVEVWNADLDQLRIRSLVAETPMVTAEYSEQSRHVVAANAELVRRRADVRSLVAERDELLVAWTPKDDRG